MSEPLAAGPCAIKLQVFEGPLDLLLHLIRANEVDIADIPVTQIAEQYLDYLELMRELNLDVAGEYLVMAATLAWIKSHMILPAAEDDEAEEGPDPRAELMARLLEYQRYKEAAESLGERVRLGRDVFALHPPQPRATPGAEREIEVGMVELIEAFRRVLAAAPQGAGFHEVEHEPITVRERMVVVMDVLARAETADLDGLFELAGDGRPSRALIVVTFLAILELVRLAALRIHQSLNDSHVPEGPIRLRRAEGAQDWNEGLPELM